MSTKFAFKSLSNASLYKTPSIIHCHKRFHIIGPTEQDWKKWAKQYGIEDIDEEENLKRDPREVTPQELRDALRLHGKFAIDHSIIPQVELPENSWYTDSHIYVQQTNLDDVWRMGYSPMRFVGTRHVEWLVFDSEPKDKKLYSESLLYFSINDYKPIKLIGQAINDIQYTMTSPFHRMQVISINEKMQQDPSLLIDDETEPNWRWIITFKWINKKEEIFSKPPINDGRYGRWFDDEQYIEWVKDTGKYKEWQLDQVTKMAENRILSKADGRDALGGSAKEQRYQKKMAEILNQEDDRPLHVKLDDQWKGLDYRGQKEVGSKSWKPSWFPF
eukprot:418584_1